jgi:hypothetical protein
MEDFRCKTSKRVKFMDTTEKVARDAEAVEELIVRVAHNAKLQQK